MKNGIQDYIASLNWNYRVQLRNKNVTYINSHGEFIDRHKLKVRGEMNSSLMCKLPFCKDIQIRNNIHGYKQVIRIDWIHYIGNL